jgi:hypothetical protein
MTSRAIVEFSEDRFGEKCYLYFDRNASPKKIESIFRKVLSEMSARGYIFGAQHFAVAFLLLANESRDNDNQDADTQEDNSQYEDDEDDDCQSAEWIWGTLSDGRCTHGDYYCVVHRKNLKDWTFTYDIYKGETGENLPVYINAVQSARKKIRDQVVADIISVVKKGIEVPRRYSEHYCYILPSDCETFTDLMYDELKDKYESLDDASILFVKSVISEVIGAAAIEGVVEKYIREYTHHKYKTKCYSYLFWLKPFIENMIQKENVQD